MLFTYHNTAFYILASGFGITVFHFLFLILDSYSLVNLYRPHPIPRIILILRNHLVSGPTRIYKCTKMIFTKVVLFISSDPMGYVIHTQFIFHR